VATNARIVLQGEWWRVVCVELPDQHGVVRPEYVVEMTDAKAKDCLGVQQWKELKDSSAHSDHIKCWRYFLDELLKKQGETPNALHRERK
jgi:hypothetical protein